jgi:hypothetical protein
MYLEKPKQPTFWKGGSTKKGGIGDKLNLDMNIRKKIISGNDFFA